MCFSCEQQAQAVLSDGASLQWVGVAQSTEGCREYHGNCSGFYTKH